MMTASDVVEFPRKWQSIHYDKAAFATASLMTSTNKSNFKAGAVLVESNLAGTSVVNTQ